MTALEAEVWAETATKGRQEVVAAWRKEEVDAARRRQEKIKATRDRESHYRTRKRRILRSDTHWPSRRVEESCTDARRTETCVAPRHVNASRNFISLSSNEQRGGGAGGGALPGSFFVLFSLFSRPRAGLVTV